MALSLTGALPFGPAIAYEAHRMTTAIMNDMEYGTTRNTTEGAVGAMGAGVGAVAGGATGAKVGTMIMPGVGTVVGTTVGATVGAIVGDKKARDFASDVFDEWEYDVKIFRCKSCGKRFKCRVYTSQSRRYCKKCNDEDYDFP